jgi:hypothetical protein
MGMNLFAEPRTADRDASPHPDDQHVDSITLRILATWIAQRAERDPGLGATVEHGFVVAQARA